MIKTPDEFAAATVDRLAGQMRLHPRQEYFRLTRAEVEALVAARKKTS